MTVCVAIKVNDGIVFAADSAVSLTTYVQQGPVVSNVWKNGLKVFNLHRDFPIVGMFAGLAHFGPVSISYLAKDLRVILEKNIFDNTYDFKKVVDYACKYFKDAYRKSQPNTSLTHSFEFWIGGYDFQ
ncbi:MAG: hypothetical protein OXD45_09565 [Rhodobacteraceae bacterium]|nr:hypothetical protein [Paracoccaceae bacterium]